MADGFDAAGREWAEVVFRWRVTAGREGVFVTQMRQRCARLAAPSAVPGPPHLPTGEPPGSPKPVAPELVMQARLLQPLMAVDPLVWELRVEVPLDAVGWVFAALSRVAGKERPRSPESGTDDPDAPWVGLDHLPGAEPVEQASPFTGC